MSKPSLAEPSVRAVPATMIADRTLAHPAVLALASAFLLWLSFPPADCGYLAWFALAPLMLLIKSNRSPRTLYFAAWLGGEAFWLLAIEWVRRVDPSAWLGWVVMATFLSLWWPGFLWFARRATRTHGIPLMVAAPVVWVAWEYVRAYILTGFPWYYLAHAQYRYLPLIQMTDLAGGWGLSLLVALVNAWWVELGTTPLVDATAHGRRLARSQRTRLAVVAGCLAATVIYGLVRIGSAAPRPGPRLALLQSNFEQGVKMSLEAEAILARFKRLIEQAAAERAELIVWPETAYPRGFPQIHPAITLAALDKQAKSLNAKGTGAGWKKRAAFVAAELQGGVDVLGVPMLVGATTIDFRPDGLSRYNSAILLLPGGQPVQSYHKLHLVPFGEYVPLIRTFPWLTRLTPYHGDVIPSLNFGAKPFWFQWKGLSFATAICFEDTVPHVVRRFFAEAPAGRRPDLLLNLSNDGWFHGSSELDMHLAASVFRAVENRVPLARAVNTGVSALIDGNGLIVARLGKLKEAVLTVDVPLDGRRTLYAACGDWLPQVCLVASLLVVLPTRRRQGAGKPQDTA